MAKRETKLWPAYEYIKNQLRTGAYRPGQKIEIQPIIDAVSLIIKATISTQPVRMALYLLVNERLVEAHPNEGFHAPLVTELSLRDLYTVHFQHLLLCLHLCRADMVTLSPLPLIEIGPEGDVGLATERLFLAIADLSGNIDLRRYIENENDRLHAVRRMKDRLILDRIVEFEEIAAAFAQGDLTQLETLLVEYIERRKNLVPQFVKLLHQARG